MWTEIARAQSARAGRRHASDLDDAEWGPIEPDTPRRKPLGRRRRVALRAVVNAILHVCRAGCPWRMLPTDGRDTYALVKSGIMRGASIEFHAIDERVPRERDKPLVVVLEARLVGISCVDSGAYPTSTIEARERALETAAPRPIRIVL